MHTGFLCFASLATDGLYTIYIYLLGFCVYTQTGVRVFRVQHSVTGSIYSRIWLGRDIMRPNRPNLLRTSSSHRWCKIYVSSSSMAYMRVEVVLRNYALTGDVAGIHARRYFLIFNDNFVLRSYERDMWRLLSLFLRRLRHHNSKHFTRGSERGGRGRYATVLKSRYNRLKPTFLRYRVAQLFLAYVLFYKVGTSSFFNIFHHIDNIWVCQIA